MLLWYTRANWIYRGKKYPPQYTVILNYLLNWKSLSINNCAINFPLNITQAERRYPSRLQKMENNRSSRWTVRRYKIYKQKKIKRQNTQISKYSQYKITLRITKLSGFVTPQGTKGKAHLYCFAYKKRLHSLYMRYISFLSFYMSRTEYFFSQQHMHDMNIRRK